MNAGNVIFKFTGDDKDLTNKTKGIASNIGSGLASAAKMGAAAIAGVSAALIGVVGASVKAYGALEQSIGGVETLFKDSADSVIANAKKAYETAGVDANTYMEQVTSFSASLLQSLGGDTKKAAATADMAIIDMADNANKMGTSIEAIQNAYQGFAKQNYTMLDNLKLGYGGTKTEMERLLVDAEKLSGVKYDINNLNDVYNAIHVIQGELGITGTTAEEAMSTIQGSAAAASAAWGNFLSGAGGIDEVIDTVLTLGDNIGNAIVEMAPKIIDGIVKMINGLVPKLPGLIKKLLPVVIKGAVELINGLVQALPTIIDALIAVIPMLIEMIPKIIESLLAALPTIINALIQMAIQVIQALAQMLPTLLPTIIKGILQLIPMLINNLPLIINAGIQLLLGLIEGLIAAIPILIEMAPEIVMAIISALIQALPMLMSVGPQLIIKLIGGIINALPALILAAPKMIAAIIKGLIDGISKVFDVGKNLVKGLWNGIADMKNWVLDKVKGFGKAILDGIKGIFGIKSPSREMFAIGGYIDEGLINGIDSMKKDVTTAYDGLFDLSPQLYGTATQTLSPNIMVINDISLETDPLGQVVDTIKSKGNGNKPDYSGGVA